MKLKTIKSYCCLAATAILLASCSKEPLPAIAGVWDLTCLETIIYSLQDGVEQSRSSVLTIETWVFNKNGSGAVRSCTKEIPFTYERSKTHIITHNLKAGSTCKRTWYIIGLDEYTMLLEHETLSNIVTRLHFTRQSPIN